jgi:hypothetical protein
MHMQEMQQQQYKMLAHPMCVLHYGTEKAAHHCF